jgi:hypothetical protein
MALEMETSMEIKKGPGTEIGQMELEPTLIPTTPRKVMEDSMADCLPNVAEIKIKAP